MPINNHTRVFYVRHPKCHVTRGHSLDRDAIWKRRQETCPCLCQSSTVLDRADWPSYTCIHKHYIRLLRRFPSPFIENDQFPYL